MFHIRSRRGAKVNDITNMLATMKENTYSTVTVLVGANNCSTTENSDIEDILASYDKLLTEANRVAALTVRISSLCPRTRDVVEDRKIKDVNVRLKQKAVQKGYKFIDNDTNFRFQDGNADSSVLQSDGVHLNSKGVERLISNLGLSKHIFYRKIGNIKKTNNSFSQTATTSPVVKVPQSALQYKVSQPPTSQLPPSHFSYPPPTHTPMILPSQPPQSVIPRCQESYQNQYTQKRLSARTSGPVLPPRMPLNLNSRANLTWRTPAPFRSSSTRRTTPDQLKCFNCGIMGHISKNCRLPNPVICLTCGNQGHKSSSCALNFIAC